MKWSFYDPETGLFSAKKFSAPSSRADAIALNTPPGLVAIEGEFDFRRHRFDLESGSVVDDPELSVDHERRTNDDRERSDALAQIKELEERQHRRVREILSREHPELAEIETQIEERRQRLRSKGF
jgi:hypothetical protein